MNFMSAIHRFFGSLYRLDGRWHKYAWTYDAFGAKSSTVFGSGKKGIDFARFCSNS